MRKEPFKEDRGQLKFRIKVNHLNGSLDFRFNIAIVVFTKSMITLILLSENFCLNIFKILPFECFLRYIH